MKKKLLAILMIFALLYPCLCLAEEGNEAQPELPLERKLPNGHTIYFQDNAQRFTMEEVQRIFELMEEVGEWGNVYFLSTNYKTSNPASYAKGSYYQKFGNSSGLMFLISKNQIYFYTKGNMHRRISNYNCNLIADNIYTMASRGQFANCASVGFQQILHVLHNELIPQTMRIICTALLALVLGMLLSLGYMIFTTLPEEKTIRSVQINSHIIKRQATFLKRVRKPSDYDSDTDSSYDGGGGGGDSGGSSGGGGDDSGGGGHSF